MSNAYLGVLLIHFITVTFILKLTSYVFPWFLFLISAISRWNVAIVMTSLLLTPLTFRFSRKRFLSIKVDSKSKAVLITGCDSGFGNLLAKRLDSKGYHVFASCLFPAGPGATELKEGSSQRLQIFELDVTKDESVKNAVEFVSKNLGSSELWAIVNNAGAMKGISVEFSSLEDFQFCMNVNAFGPLRIMKAFLPFIRRSKGRIVNITSSGGRISTPHWTPYVMSKFAFVGLNDCLRQEISSLGIPVISVEPGLFRTVLTDENNLRRNLDLKLSAVEDEVKKGYGEKYIKGIMDFYDVCIKKTSSNVELVIDDMESAVSLEYPESVYKPRRDIFSRILLDIYEVSPSDLTDLIKTFMSLRTYFLKISTEEASHISK